MSMDTTAHPAQARPALSDGVFVWARFYASFGLKTTPNKPRSKEAYSKGWAHKKKGTPSDYFRTHQKDNIGVVLEHSRLASLDIDDMEASRSILRQEGIDLDAFLQAPDRVQCEGRPDRGKLFYRLPKGIEAPKTCKKNHPPTSPDEKPKTIIELRCKGAQDLLPPSIHPDTQRPYFWIKGPENGFPDLPPELLSLWHRWNEEGKPPNNCQDVPAGNGHPVPTSPGQQSRETTGGHFNELDREVWDKVRTKIKERFTVKDQLSRMGAQNAGGNSYLCPFHEEEHSSFWIYDGWDGYLRWYDSHDSTGGDVLDLYQRHRRLSSPGEATTELARELGVMPEPRQRNEEDEAPACSDPQILDDPIYIDPALAFVDNRVLIARPVRVQKQLTKGGGKDNGEVACYEAQELRLITSDHQLLPVPEPVSKDKREIIPLGDGFYLRGGSSGNTPARWSTGSINAFLSGNAEAPDVAALYSDLVKAFRSWCWFPEEHTYHVLALHVLGSYFFELYPAYPYINMNGPRGSGKTTVGRVAEALGFNGHWNINFSEAALFRTIQREKPYLVIDEAENMKNRADADTFHALMSILKAGYQRGVRVPRQNKNNIEITEYFSVYSPKMICNVHGLEDILQDRSIVIVTQEAPKSVVLRDDQPDKDMRLFVDLRDRLYLALMHYHREIVQVRDGKGVDQETTRLRERELFKPLIDLAHWVDFHGNTRDATHAITAALECQKDVRYFNRVRTPEALLLEALFQLLGNEDEVEVTCEDIKIAVRQLTSDPVEFCNEIWIGRILRTEGIIKHKRDTRRVERMCGMDRKKLTAYRVRRERVRDLEAKSEGEKR